MAGCQRLVAAQDAALRSAAITLDDWQVHIGAMNKFAVGAVTTKQLLGFWDRSSLAAFTRLQDFHDAAGRLPALPSACPPPTQGGQDADLRACSEAATSRREALDSARTAADAWERQLRAMQQLRSGVQSASQATDAWLGTWQTSLRQLEDYRRSAHDLPLSAVCSG